MTAKEISVEVKSLFDGNLVCLIERVAPLVAGLKQCYSIDIPLLPPETGNILDKVSTWLVTVQNELSKYKRAQRLSICSRWNANSVTLNQDGTFSSEFLVSIDDLPNEKALLRGINLEYVGSSQRPTTLIITPPPNTSISGAGPLVVGRVGPISPSLEMKPQHADALWNSSPLGVWKVDGRGEQVKDLVQSIVLHMWVASV